MSHRIGGGVRAGKPIIGHVQESTSVWGRETEEEKAARLERMAESFRQVREAEAERQRKAEVEKQKYQAFLDHVQQMQKDSAPVGSIVAAPAGATANVYCEIFNGKPSMWALVRLESVYPNEPFFYLGAQGRFGMRAFLVKRDVDRLLTPDDLRFLEETSSAYPSCKITKVRVIGKSQSGKSLTVEVVE